jgi:hypothetical protein
MGWGDLMGRVAQMASRMADSDDHRQAVEERERAAMAAEAWRAEALRHHREQYPGMFTDAGMVDGGEYEGLPPSVILARCRDADWRDDRASDEEAAQRQAEADAKRFHYALTRPTLALGEILALAADTPSEDVAVIPPHEPPPQPANGTPAPVSRARRLSAERRERLARDVVDSDRDIQRAALQVTGRVYSTPQVAAWTRRVGGNIGHKVTGTAT